MGVSEALSDVIHSLCPGLVVKTQIESSAFTHLPTPPCVKDEVRCEVSVGHLKLEGRCCDEYWPVFRKVHPSSAAKIE
jgi:hypothetical protein